MRSLGRCREMPRRGPHSNALPYTHQMEFARWIEEAKRDETRERRVSQALQMLREGKTRSKRQLPDSETARSPGPFLLN